MNNNWILTHSGVEFDLENPTPEMVNLDDIAHALSRIQRFNGHTDVNCSVALHSVIVSCAVGGDLAKQALLHDAHEAYMGDIMSPVKWIIDGPIKVLEQGLDRAISARLKVDLHPNKLLKRYDLAHLRYEREQFLAKSKPWPILEGIEPIHVHSHLARYYGKPGPHAHKDLFLNRCKELGVGK